MPTGHKFGIPQIKCTKFLLEIHENKKDDQSSRRLASHERNPDNSLIIQYHSTNEQFLCNHVKDFSISEV